MLETQDLQELAEMGFCAVSTGNMLKARTIFEGILAERPGHNAPLMGLAMSHYMIDEFDEAEKILRGIIEKDPDYQLARVHLGLALILAGKREEALPLLQEAAKSDDPLFKDMVAELLENPA
ncbi:MAG: tetratricopeptide repeat protein [Deltaproteobacteria bacterium]|jgi:tetratricopeptide (TPR) repeat protein|nr:tetratricopeptide repeat protein [Deltaproteobacteria bacterium]